LPQLAWLRQASRLASALLPEPRLPVSPDPTGPSPECLEHSGGHQQQVSLPPVSERAEYLQPPRLLPEQLEPVRQQPMLCFRHVPQQEFRPLTFSSCQS
jgi:hypothetical protein